MSAPAKDTAKADKAVKTAKPKTKKAAPSVLPVSIKDYEIILSPVVTEKATNGSQYNQVTFRVLRAATKPVIKTAVERLFNVKVTAVNTHNRRGKTKRFKGKLGHRSDVKFAVITLAEGNKIDVTTGL